MARRSQHNTLRSHLVCVDLCCWQHCDGAIEMCFERQRKQPTNKSTFFGFGDVLMTLEPHTSWRGRHLCAKLERLNLGVTEFQTDVVLYRRSHSLLCSKVHHVCLSASPVDERMTLIMLKTSTSLLWSTSRQLMLCVQQQRPSWSTFSTYSNSRSFSA